MELVSDLHGWLDSVATEHRDLITQLYLFLPPGTLDESTVPRRGNGTQNRIRCDLGARYGYDTVLDQELRIHDELIEDFDFDRWNKGYAFWRARCLGQRD